MIGSHRKEYVLDCGIRVYEVLGAGVCVGVEVSGIL